MRKRLRAASATPLSVGGSVAGRIVAGPLIACLLLVACSSDEAPSGDSGPSVKLNLVDHEKWELIPEADDPFAALRKPDAKCDPKAFYVESELGDTPWIDITTRLCDFFTVKQATLHDIKKGATLVVAVRHFDLTAPDPGDGYVAVMIGGEKVWDKTVKIPAKDTIIIEELPAPADAPKGTPLVFHLHNHGENSWQLFQIQVK